MKVALYARCSTKKQDLDSQVLTLKNWAEKYRRAVVCEYVDFTYDANKIHVGMASLIEEAKKKTFDVVTITEMSRLGQSNRFVHEVAESLSESNIKIFPVNVGVLLDYSSIAGATIIGSLALAAELEHRF